MNRIVAIVSGAVLVAAVAAGSFYGGMMYGENQAEAGLQAPGDFEGMPGGREQFGGMAGNPPGADQGQADRTQGGSLFGEIQSIGSGQLTIVDQSGEEVQINVTDTTMIQKQAEVSLADLEEGETVVISGSRGDDGSVTARLLQVSPSAGGLFGPPGDRGAGDQ